MNEVIISKYLNMNSILISFKYLSNSFGYSFFQFVVQLEFCKRAIDTIENAHNVINLVKIYENNIRINYIF